MSGDETVLEQNCQEDLGLAAMKIKLVIEKKCHKWMMAADHQSELLILIEPNGCVQGKSRTKALAASARSVIMRLEESLL